MSLVNHIKRIFGPKQPRLPKVMHCVEMLLVSMQQRENSLDRERNLDWEFEHIRLCVKYAKMLAASRKIDPDIAACAVALQNIGRVITGKSEDHAEAGYEPAKRILAGLGCFTPQEIEMIATSVRRHSRKERVDTPLDELAKDVDIYARYCQGHEFTRPHDITRLTKIRQELHMGGM